MQIEQKSFAYVKCFANWASLIKINCIQTNSEQNAWPHDQTIMNFNMTNLWV